MIMVAVGLGGRRGLSAVGGFVPEEVGLVALKHEGVGVWVVEVEVRFVFSVVGGAVYVAGGWWLFCIFIRVIVFAARVVGLLVSSAEERCRLGGEGL